MSIHIQDLAIEITRRCNMQCTHCLRGGAQNIDIQSSYIADIFKKIDSIGTLTITGGEPSLRPLIIELIIFQAKKYKVDIENFYIVTNGKTISDSFITACTNLYLYCSGEKEYNMVQLSNDYYHKGGGDDWNKLDLFKFSSKKNDNDNTRYSGGLISEGRAKEVGQREAPVEDYVIDIYDDDIRITEGIVYLNAVGELIRGCNFSFKNQSKHKICNSSEDFISIIQKECSEQSI